MIAETLRPPGTMVPLVPALVLRPISNCLHQVMPHRLQSISSSSSEDEYSNEEKLCIERTQAAAGRERTEFMPLAPVVGTDGASYESFEAYIASLPAKNCHVVPDERFKRFVRLLRGDSTASDDPVQLKRDREKLFNTKELGPKAPDGTCFPFGAISLFQVLFGCSVVGVHRLWYNRHPRM